MKYTPVFLLVAGIATSFGQTTDDGTKERNREIPEITIFGNQDDITAIPGSATEISHDDIVQFNQSDIQRMIRQVPGVSVQIEDGFGLRPNLSIRGTASERSARITLLEDGVLIAPAPYAAPSAYYFPTAGRLSTVEVLKGPAAITEGPYTVGGAINLISTPIPSERTGMINLQAGENSTWRTHANYGDDSGRFGWLVETHQWQSDGFQKLDSGDDTGLEKEDYLVKLRYSTDEAQALYQQLDLKLHYASENSDQSYLGLSDADFKKTPLRRYGVSALDNIETEHDQAILRYLVRNNRVQVTATVYNNEFERDWFKTGKFNVTGSLDAQTYSGLSWGQVVQAINTNTPIGAVTPDLLTDILNGGDSAAGAIQIRSNARKYYSRGIDIDVQWTADFASTSHNFSAGIRRHFDHSERLQRNSTYTQLGGELALDDLGLLGNAGNREQNADVWAFWLRDEIDFGRLQLSPGLRYEMIEQDRTRWETRPGLTADPSSRDPDNIRDQRENNTNVLIPGLGFTYEISDRWSAYGGVHKGFSAPSNAPGVDEEKSINYELGARLSADSSLVDAGLFLTDYDNLVGTCTVSSGVDCEVGDAFNGDAATVTGFELSMAHIFSGDGSLRFPVSLSYTHINAKFDSDIADTDFFGNVSKGDPLPYIPKNQALVKAGVEGEHWGAYVSANFIDGACVRASCGSYEATDASTFIDASFFISVNERITLAATLENLNDEATIVGRTPYGARPNKPRTATLGIRVAL